MDDLEQREKKHSRLSTALCEAVEFGRPTKIKIGHSGFTELLASLDADSGPKIRLCGEPTFEGVPVEIDPQQQGCIVEHDGRYEGAFMGELAPKAIPESLAYDRRTRKSVIVAW